MNAAEWSSQPKQLACGEYINLLPGMDRGGGILLCTSPFGPRIMFMVKTPQVFSREIQSLQFIISSLFLVI